MSVNYLVYIVGELNELALTISNYMCYELVILFTSLVCYLGWIVFSVVLEVMNMRKVQRYMEPVLEPLIRQVVSTYPQNVLLYITVM